jgi:hypothetical protein
MKKTLIILFLIIAGLYFSCKKDDNGKGEIYGKWKLTETMADPGDGSGKYVKVTGSANYITFSTSGELSGKAIPEAASYKILDSVRIEIAYKDNPAPLVFWYKVTSNTLQLNPPCIEGCGLRFVRN